MGGEAKETEMVLKVNLACEKCILKIKKVLCCTPQIRDQTFDKKSNTVTIKVICCTPKKVADKLRCKAGGTIKDIEIKPSQRPLIPPEVIIIPVCQPVYHYTVWPAGYYIPDENPWTCSVM